MWVPGQFGIENYLRKVGITQNVFVNIANFLFVIFCVKMFHRTRPIYVDTIRPKCVDSSCVQYMQ